MLVKESDAIPCLDFEHLGLLYDWPKGPLGLVLNFNQFPLNISKTLVMRKEIFNPVVVFWLQWHSAGSGFFGMSCLYAGGTFFREEISFAYLWLLRYITFL